MPSERAMARAGRSSTPAGPVQDAGAAGPASVTVAGEAVYTGDVENYHDPRPEEPGDAGHGRLDPER